MPGAEDVPSAVVDISAPDFTQQLRALLPELVIHCAGPFQGQDYRVANEPFLTLGGNVLLSFYKALSSYLPPLPLYKLRSKRVSVREREIVDEIQ